MKIYRRLDTFGSKLAIVLCGPLRSTVPFIPSCVTREKYFTTRCAQPLQAVAAHLTAVYHSCAGYSIFKFLICPSNNRELGVAFCIPISHDFHIDLYSCTIMCTLVVLLFNKKTAPATVKVTSAVWLSNIYYGTFILICIKCGDIYYSFVTTFLKIENAQNSIIFKVLQ